MFSALLAMTAVAAPSPSPKLKAFVAAHEECLRQNVRAFDDGTADVKKIAAMAGVRCQGQLYYYIRSNYDRRQFPEVSRRMNEAAVVTAAQFVVEKRTQESRKR